MARRKSAASPLALFLDYLVTAPLQESKAAIEASIAILRVRETLPTLHTRKPTLPPFQPVAGSVLIPGPPTGPVGVPSPAAAPAARRGRKPGSKNLSTSERMAANAPRRRRPPVANEGTFVVDVPSVNPLPDQTVPDQNEEV